MPSMFYPISIILQHIYFLLRVLIMLVPHLTLLVMGNYYIIMVLWTQNGVVSLQISKYLFVCINFCFMLQIIWFKRLFRDVLYMFKFKICYCFSCINIRTLFIELYDNYARIYGINIGQSGIPSEILSLRGIKC